MEMDIEPPPSVTTTARHGSKALDSSSSNPEEAILQAPALTAMAQFLQQFWLRVAAISVAVLIPCFWHRTIQAGDLASHVYNAWLAQLIERGQAPGLWIAHQWSNVLFDLALLYLGDLFGLHAAERIAVSAAVLIFFWGAFAMVCAMSRRVAWLVLPCLAMLAYGWTFAQGFMNYYISLGFAFWGLALIRRGRGRERWLVLALVPVIWLAHPLGLALLVGVGIYMVAAQRVGLRGQAVLFAGATAGIVAARLYLDYHDHPLFSPYPLVQFLYEFNGADQLILYGTRYELAAVLLLALIITAVLTDYFGDRGERDVKSAYALPLQLYALAFIAAPILPWVIFPAQYGAPLGLLTERLTSVTAVLAFCLLGTVKPQKWHVAGLATICLVFFFFLYSDTGKLDKMETQAGRYERVIPRGQRIITTIWPFLGSRVLVDHLVDRACTGYCFSYANYEAPSRQFRVRANPGNPYVTTDWRASDAIAQGEYIIQPRDVPIFQIYQCNLNMTELCMRELSPGERNGSVGVQRAVVPANP